MASRRNKVSSTWRRPPTRTYDYNYNLGEHYYRPLTRYIDERSLGKRNLSPPGARTFAERLAADPIDGVRSRNWRDRQLNDECPRPASMVMDDLPPLQIPSKLDELEPSKDDDFLLPRRRRNLASRLDLPDKILDAAGLRSPARETSHSAGILDEDPFISAKLNGAEEAFWKRARNVEDNLANTLDNSLNLADENFGARARAKARLAEIEQELEDDTGIPVHPECRLVGRRERLALKNASEANATQSVSSNRRALRIRKRVVRATEESAY